MALPASYINKTLFAFMDFFKVLGTFSFKPSVLSARGLESIFTELIKIN